MCFSVRAGHTGVQWLGDGDAFDDGSSLLERCGVCSSSPPRALHLPPDALPLRQLSGESQRWIQKLSISETITSDFETLA